MTLRYCLFLAAVLATVPVSAHNHETCSHTSKRFITALPEFPKRPYDIFLYRLTLDLRPAFETKQPIYYGTAEIHITTTADADTLELDAGSQVMTKVVVNGAEIIPTPQPQKQRLRIPLEPSLRPSGTHLTIVIDYERANTENRGANFYPKGHYVGLGPKPAEDSIFVEEDIFYTMSEPFDARHWLPCNDHPHEKMAFEVLVRTPSDVTVTSNGELLWHEVGNATDEWFFKSDQQLPSYLMVVNASKFVSWEETVARVDNPADSIPLSFHVWKADYDQDSITDGSKYNARYSFRTTRNMMTAFEKYFGPYPFKRYGQTAVQPINIGGMEHQSMTTVNRSWLRGWSEGGIAHELGHQWFGDKVTCETFKDLWLNEGFATFSEALYSESWGGKQWYLSTILSKARGYFFPIFDSRNDLPIYDLPFEELFNSALTYNKAASVIHHLRRLVDNDSLFFNALQKYTDEFAYGNANTETFRIAMSQLLNLDLQEFIDQWIYGAKHPEFQILWAQNPTNRLYLRINQVQSVRDHFTMPVRFLAYRGTTVDTIKVMVDSRTTSFNTLINGTIDSLIYDPDYGALSIATVEYDASLGVHEPIEEMSVTIDQMTKEIVCRSSGDEPFSIEIYDALGKRLAREQSYSALFKLTTSAFPSGMYVVKMASTSKTLVRSIPVVR